MPIGFVADVENLDAVDVAIVGGGVGGCYLAYRLACAAAADVRPGSRLARLLEDRRDGLTVALYEGGERIGGRLWSVCLPGAPSVAADLGGMRFGDESPLVIDLVRHLGLQPTVEPFSFGEPETFTYVRGLRLRQAQPDRLPYRLRPHERGLSQQALLELAADAAVPGFSVRRRAYHGARRVQRGRDADAVYAAYADARRRVSVEGVGLGDLSWWALMRQALSQEAVALIQDAGGYDMRAACGAAGAWLDTFFFEAPEGAAWRLRGGFEALPRALHARRRAAGGRLRLSHRLERFDVARDGPGYDLVFDRGDAQGPAQVRARALVLSLPQPALQRLQRHSPVLRGDVVQQGLDSVEGVAAVKLFLAYPHPWWATTGVVKGRSTTDLPLRQLWYWGGEPDGGPAVVLGAYADGPAAAYWSDLAHGEPFRDAPGYDAGPARAGPFASKMMVRRAHAMLMEVHGVAQAPEPIAARFQDWSRHPDNGGWHVWRPGSHPDRIIPLMRQPWPGEAVFIASDCWTYAPGSVQGTLSACERILQDQLGLGWPDWLRRDGFPLGPSHPP